MSKFFIGLIVLMFSVNAFAALAPFHQSSREIQEILDNVEVENKIGSGRAITGINTTETGFMVSTNTGHRLPIDILYITNIEVVGPVKFLLTVKNLEEPQSLEKVTVKNVEQFKNNMPGPGSEDHPTRTVLTVNVFSGGCTSAEDFKLEILQRDNLQQVKIIRTKPDFCEAYLPEGVNIEMETNKLKLNSTKAITILNPLFVHEKISW